MATLRRRNRIRAVGYFLAVVWALNLGLIIGLFRAASGGFDDDF